MLKIMFFQMLIKLRKTSRARHLKKLEKAKATVLRRRSAYESPRLRHATATPKRACLAPAPRRPGWIMDCTCWKDVKAQVANSTSNHKENPAALPLHADLVSHPQKRESSQRRYFWTFCTLYNRVY